MHADEVDIDANLVRRLVAAQLPHLAALPVKTVCTTGTVNAVFRLGDGLYARLPRLEHWGADLAKELEWLPTLAPRLSLAIPAPVAAGEPGCGYPFPWAVYRWLPGDTFSLERVRDETEAAAALARFVAELRSVTVTGAPSSGRPPLRELDTVTREAIASLTGVIDTDGATRAWDGCLEAPPWAGPHVWCHGDLLPTNLLVDRGRLMAVLDFGESGAGDPALDVIAAWSVFGPRGRDVFRHQLAVDEVTWARARGFALHQALLIIPYQAVTNPAFADMAKRTVCEVLSDLDLLRDFGPTPPR